jgi:hypothetical protein
MKRLISLLLLAAITFTSTAVSATAANDSLSNVGEPLRSITVAEQGDDMIAVIGGTDALSQKTYNIDTAYNDIVMSSDGYYAMELVFDESSAFIPVGKFEIDITDEYAFSDAMSRDDISDYAKLDIEAARLNAIETGNAECSITVFSSKLLDAPRVGEVRTELYYIEEPSADLRTQLSSANGGAMSTQSITYLPWSNGPVAVMGVEDVVYNNNDTDLKRVANDSAVGTFVNGTGAMNVKVYGCVSEINGLYSIGSVIVNAILVAIGAIEEYSTFVNLASTASPLLNVLRNKTGLYFTPAGTGDFLEIAPHYNKTYRYIFGPGNQLGVRAVNVKVTKWYFRFKMGTMTSPLSPFIDVDQNINSSSFTVPSTGFADAYARVQQGLNPLKEDAVWNALNAGLIVI